MKKFLKGIAIFLSFTILLTIPQNSFAVSCAESAPVIFNEIAWPGNLDSSNDEWIELFNPSCQEIDLAGWKIFDDDDAVYTIESGKISSIGFFLIEDTENAVRDLPADVIINISLANTGDNLVLKNAQDEIIDELKTANAWYAGNNTSKATMERISAAKDTNDATNWQSAIAGDGHVGSNGHAILGTPRGPNSVSIPPAEIPEVILKVPTSPIGLNQEFAVDAEVHNVTDLFAYGITIDYDPRIVKYLSSNAGTFLSKNNTVETAFQSGVENQQAGRVIIAETLLNNPAEMVTGSGTLASINFQLIDAANNETAINFGNDSFLANDKNDIISKFVGNKISIDTEGNFVSAPKNFQAQNAESRYALKLTWEKSDAPVSSFILFKKNPQGQFVTIGEVEGQEFIDDQNIVPGVIYNYQIVSKKEGNQSTSLAVTGTDTRGLKGDANRSDRVDGRDLQGLGRHFATEIGNDAYDPLYDFNYDGRIDGQDLIELAAKWALVYQQ